RPHAVAWGLVSLGRRNAAPGGVPRLRADAEFSDAVSFLDVLYGLFRLVLVAPGALEVVAVVIHLELPGNQGLITVTVVKLDAWPWRAEAAIGFRVVLFRGLGGGLGRSGLRLFEVRNLAGRHLQIGHLQRTGSLNRPVHLRVVALVARELPPGAKPVGRSTSLLLIAHAGYALHGKQLFLANLAGDGLSLLELLPEGLVVHADLPAGFALPAALVDLLDRGFEGVLAAASGEGEGRYGGHCGGGK